jgi:hypothetical protein
MHTSQQPSQLPADAPVIDTTARWLDEHSDESLGCECANPALQIERWGQEGPSQVLCA